MHIVEVHSNESACRKSGRLGLEQVVTITTNVTPSMDSNSIINYNHLSSYTSSEGGTSSTTSKVQPYQRAYISPPRVQHAPSPTIDPSTNPWIEVVYNRKKTSPSIPTKPNSDSPRQVQRHLLRTPINDGANFCAQAAQHLVAQHMFNLPYTFHIYNNKGNK